MSRFIVRRLLAMVVVMFVISLLTFLLFEAIPNGNPAFRLAGRTATPQEIQQIEVKYGFNKPIYVQYLRTMKNIFTGQAYSYTQGFNVLSRDQGGPAGDAVAGVRRRVHLAVHVDPRRHLGRDQGGQVHRPGADGPVDGRRLVPAVLPRRGADLLPRLQGEHLPARRLRQVHHRARCSGSCT